MAEASEGGPGTDVEPTQGGGWFAVPAPFPAEGRTVSLELAGRRVLLCQVEGQNFALEDQCPHVRVPLAGGRLVGFHLECPLHGGRLDIRDGSSVALPIRRAAVVFPLRQTEAGLEIQLA